MEQKKKGFKTMFKMKKEQRCKERNEEERGFKMKEQWSKYWTNSDSED